MPNAWDDYVDERGGLLLKYRSASVSAHFDDGQFGPQLTIEATLEHPEDYPRIANGVILNWFNLPNGWRINGDKVEAVAWTAKNGNEQEPPTKFRNDSSIGRLVSQMKAVDPEGKTLANGSVYEAAYWNKTLSGLVQWDAVNTPKRVQNAEGTWVEDPAGKDVSMPVELLSAAGSNGKAPASFDIQSLGADPTQLDILRAAATASKNVGEFQAAIIAPLAGQPVLGAVMKQPGDVYASLLVS